jgi:hypothetical protein
MNKSLISDNDEQISGQVPSGCFDGLDTNCDGTVHDADPLVCPFEGMYLDDPSIDFDDWYSHYENDYGSPIPEEDYNVAVVRDKNCLDGVDNDKSWDDSNIPTFCKNGLERITGIENAPMRQVMIIRNSCLICLIMIAII